MDDMISRQAAIDAVEELDIPEDMCVFEILSHIEVALGTLPSAQPDVSDTNVGKICEYYDLCRNGRDEKKLREELLSAQPGWIPVAERLPERDKDVLVTRDYDGRADYIKSCRYVEVASCYGEDDDVSWNSYSDEYKMTPKNHRVLAWMPLPEPYTGKDNSHD